jgi:hypothetical protein
MSVALEQEYKYFLSHLEEFSKAHLNEFVFLILTKKPSVKD